MVAGIAVHERDAWYVQRKLHNVVAKHLPAGLDPLLHELHAGEIKSPNRYTRQGRPSSWRNVDFATRMRILNAAYATLAGYACEDPVHPCAIFGSIVDSSYRDRIERAYEEVLHRFDEMLTRRGRATGAPHQLGLAIHDKAVVEGSVQDWTTLWRNAAGRIGKLTHLADVPVFADSRASRLIQAADLIAWAFWRFYGLPTPDSRFVNGLWPLVDADGGKLHGVVHVTPAFRTGKCACPPCASRAGSSPAPSSSASS